MRPLVIIILLLFIAKLGLSQNNVYKFRVDSSFFSSKNNPDGSYIWEIVPAVKNTLLVYDGDKSKINIYSDVTQDLSIIKHLETIGDQSKEWTMYQMECIDQDNRRCEVSLTLYKDPIDKKHHTQLIIDYLTAKYRFDLRFD